MDADDEITVTAVFLETDIGPMPEIGNQSRKLQFACDKCTYRCAREDILTAHKRFHDDRFRQTFVLLKAKQEQNSKADEFQQDDSKNASGAHDGRKNS